MNHTRNKQQQGQNKTQRNVKDWICFNAAPQTVHRIPTNQIESFLCAGSVNVESNDGQGGHKKQRMTKREKHWHHL